jgi:hypothetical protein
MMPVEQFGKPGKKCLISKQLPFMAIVQHVGTSSIYPYFQPAAYLGPFCGLNHEMTTVHHLLPP